MPVKFKQSVKTYNRATNTYKIEHFYMHNISGEELLAYLDNPNSKPKIKQKVQNELTRRSKLSV